MIALTLVGPRSLERKIMLKNPDILSLKCTCKDGTIIYSEVNNLIIGVPGIYIRFTGKQYYIYNFNKNILILKDNKLTINIYDNINNEIQDGFVLEIEFSKNSIKKVEKLLIELPQEVVYNSLN